MIQPESFDAPIEVKGLPAEVLSGLFHGARGARDHWKAGLTLTADLAQRSHGGNDRHGAAFDKDLPDGLALLHGNAPGTVRVEAHHRVPEQLLPQSLYLLLAQQWARAGLLLVHAAAFRIGERGILALGGKGAGKSVLTAAAMASGARVVSDDWVMLGLDDAGTIRAERMREFLMLRHCQACAQILANLPAHLPGIRARNIPNRPKSIIKVPEPAEDAARHFVRDCNIDQIWILQRPAAGRADSTRMRPAPASAGLAAIIRATMPVLFSKLFAIEADRVGRTARALVRQCPVYRVEPGLDLLTPPCALFDSDASFDYRM